MLRLALPVLGANLLHVLVEYVDTWLAGNYLVEMGDAPMAAISLVRYSMWFIMTLFAVLTVGATALVARFVGAGDYRTANRATNQAMLLGIGLACVVVVAGRLLAGPFVQMLQLRGASAEMATQYLLMIVPALPAIMLEKVGTACLWGAGDMVGGLIAVIAINAVNVVVSSCLLLGLGPFPELGWVGLAVGTLCGRLVGGAIILTFLWRGRAGLQFSRTQMKPDRPMIRRLLRIGVPGGADALAVVSCHMWYVSIINRLGDLDAAAHGVGISIEALAYMPGAAFQAAAATMCGQFLGAGQPQRAGRSVWMALAFGGTFMTVAGIFFFFGAEVLASFFLGDRGTEVVPLAARLLRIVSFTMPALAATMVLAGGLRGAGDSRSPLAITLLGFLGVRIPLAYAFAYGAVLFPAVNWEIPGLGWGVQGAWFAMVIDTFFRCALIVARFLQGAWKGVEV